MPGRRWVPTILVAAIIGAFTIVGLAGSYTRMLLKTESFNQMRQVLRELIGKLAGA